MAQSQYIATTFVPGSGDIRDKTNPSFSSRDCMVDGLTCGRRIGAPILIKSSRRVVNSIGGNLRLVRFDQVHFLAAGTIEGLVESYQATFVPTHILS